MDDNYAIKENKGISFDDPNHLNNNPHLYDTQITSDIYLALFTAADKAGKYSKAWKYLKEFREFNPSLKIFLLKSRL